ncbi:MAG: DUF3516 domain-containing protein [Actinomycetota bacterium]
MSQTTLTELIPDDPGADELLDAFLGWVDERGIELYDAQEEAILELLGGRHVILATPTGSGKSLVALAGHFAAFARGERSVYTAPIKALVSEKFFDLCRAFGSEHVGMVTGDASVNPDAPIICCTAEILANQSLREGPDAPVQLAIADEFHYYGDSQRGWAWQVPLLELPNTRWLLMSATLGDTRALRDDIEGRTGREIVEVRSTVRPVPLDVMYRETSLLDSIEDLLSSRRAPIYLVHFTQKEATQAAQDLTSVNLLSKEEKAAVAEAIGGFRFDPGFGRDLSRWLRHGVGVHHAGMLPKYRLLVEKLAQGGHLRVICGTDTLGVGVNLPIRTVLFTQLCKYDGTRVRTLSVREFQQIAGRAGRKGLDDAGTVWVQAPEHVVENLKIDAKIAEDPKKAKKLRKKKPPERGYQHWDAKTLDKLWTGDPEKLDSNFSVSHSMLLNLLDRAGDGCRATRELMVDNHEPRSRQRRHIRRAIAIYRSLVDAEIVEVLDEPDEDGRMVRVTVDLQDEFRLNQPLSPFVLDAVELLDRETPSYALDVVSIVESVLDNPMVVLIAQLDQAKTALVNEMKAAGVEYEERMERLEQVTWPQPLAEELYETFNSWRVHHPWVEGDTVKPKSVVRDLFERAMTFHDYVRHYGLKRSEGAVLRYLTDAYRALVQTVPEWAVTDELDDLIEWLGAVVRGTDASMLEEWERLRDPDRVEEALAAGEVLPPVVDVTTNTRAFAVLVRNEAFRWVQLLARRDHAGLAEVPGATDADRWNAAAFDEVMAPFWESHDEIVTDADARGPSHHVVDGTRIEQTIVDPEGFHEWVLIGEVDLPASRDEGRAVVRLARIVHR